MKANSFEGFVPVTGSEYDELLNGLQEALYEAAERGYVEYRNTLDAYYATPESRTGETIKAVQQNAKTEWEKVVYHAGISYLQEKCPDVLEEMKKDKENKWLDDFEKYKGEHIAENLFARCVQNLKFEGYKYVSMKLYIGLARLTTGLRFIHKEVLRKHWKGIRILPSREDDKFGAPSSIGAYRSYRLYDEELQFEFSLFPDDNYYHWDTYQYSCGDENAPLRYRTREYNYGDIPEIALRI